MSELKKLIKTTLRESNGGLLPKEQLESMSIDDLEGEEDYIINLLQRASSQQERATLQQYLFDLRNILSDKYDE
jgi:hypothetical protein